MELNLKEDAVTNPLIQTWETGEDLSEEAMKNRAKQGL